MAQTTTQRVGQVLGDRYQLDRVIGSGGQGTVYRARDLRAGDEVAIKLLNDAIADDPDYRERMFREARAMTTLYGTAAVRVLDQVVAADGTLGLVMELLHGEELEDRLRRLNAEGRRMRTEDVLALFAPVVQTLQIAHDHGIVHRDLKPGNIWLMDPQVGGGVRVLDFGFAKFTRLRGFTADGLIAGSPTFISPEAWRGRTIDAQTDVYALAAIIFCCLAGHPPFESDELTDLLTQVTRAPRPKLSAVRPDLPPDLDDWLEISLAIEPSGRFQSVRAMWNAFTSVLR